MATLNDIRKKKASKKKTTKKKTTKKTTTKRKVAPKKRVASKKKTVARNKGGRPTVYKSEYPEQAYNYCLLGATDARLAEFFGVDERTINAWKKDHPEFSQSLNAGKEHADAEVANSLFQRARGYSHPEDKIFNDGGKPLIVPTIKHYPPDATSCIFWLKNRQKASWRDKLDVDAQVTGNIELNIRYGSKPEP